MKQRDNTLLITGGTSGIGLELAKQFLARNNQVIITGRSAEKLAKAKQVLGDVTTIQSDVSNPDSIKELYQHVSKAFPNLNILINNAGVMYTINLQDHALSAAELTQELDINVKGTIWMNDAFLPLLKKNNDAATVSVSSGLAFVPLPISPIYCAAKAAIHSYTQSLRVQLSNTAVKVFELVPPATATDLISGFDAADMEGTTLMPVEELVAAFLKGFFNDKYEICPGQASQLKFMSRFFPRFILKQLSKSVANMHAKQQAG